MQSNAVTPQVIRDTLGRLLESKAFKRAARHRSILAYILDKTAAGRSAEIKESNIALDVFGKESYDAQIDSQVRVEMGLLRERLDKYYSTEGAADPVRIEFQKGSYEPLFHSTAPPVNVLPSSPSSRPRRLAPVAVAVLLLITALAVLYLKKSAFGSSRDGHKPSLAVLPFEDLSPAKDQEYFCKGVTEQLTDDLGRSGVFRVVPRGMTARFRAHDHDVREIGKELNVEAIIEGSVRRENARVWVSVQVIDARQNITMWSKTFKSDMNSLLETQREIGESVAKTFNFELGATRRALTRQRTSNSEAYDHYLRAAYLLDNDVQRSTEAYRAALRADPRYALAWAGLASAWNRQVDWQFVSPEKARREALSAAEKAMALDPGLAEAHHAWGIAKLYFERDWDSAERSLLKATELDPLFDEARWEYVRLVLLPTRRFDEAIEILQAGLAIVPSSLPLHGALANARIKSGDFEAALPFIREAQRLSSTAPSPIVFQGMALAGLGRYDEAVSTLTSAVRVSRSIWALGHLGFALARAGRVHDARLIVEELEARRRSGLTPDVDIAAIHTGLGEKERAFQALDRAFASYAHSMLWLDVDFRFHDLRSDSRFARMVAAMGLKRIPRGTRRP